MPWLAEHLWGLSTTLPDNQWSAEQWSKMRNGKVKTKEDFSNLNFIIIPFSPGVLLCFFVVVNMMNRDNFQRIVLQSSRRCYGRWMTVGVQNLDSRYRGDSSIRDVWEEEEKERKKGERRGSYLGLCINKNDGDNETKVCSLQWDTVVVFSCDRFQETSKKVQPTPTKCGKDIQIGMWLRSSKVLN